MLFLRVWPQVAQWLLSDNGLPPTLFFGVLGPDGREPDGYFRAPVQRDSEAWSVGVDAADGSVTITNNRTLAVVLAEATTLARYGLWLAEAGGEPVLVGDVRDDGSTLDAAMFGFGPGKLTLILPGGGQ